MNFATTHFSVSVITHVVCNRHICNYGCGMSNTSPHIIASTERNQPTSIIGHSVPRPAEHAEPTPVHDRAHVGRFDDGMSAASEHGQAPIASIDDEIADAALAA
jgi:hypothetical protein